MTSDTAMRGRLFGAAATVVALALLAVAWRTTRLAQLLDLQTLVAAGSAIRNSMFAL